MYDSNNVIGMYPILEWFGVYKLKWNLNCDEINFFDRKEGDNFYGEWDVPVGCEIIDIINARLWYEGDKIPHRV